MEFSRLLPNKDEIPIIRVPQVLQHTFNDSLQVESTKTAVKLPDPSEKFDCQNIKHLESFFSSITDHRATSQAPKKNTTRRSLEGNLSSSSKRHSFGLDEFPLELLKENVDRLNSVSRKIHQQLDHINGIEGETESFQRTVDDLNEAVHRLQEKTKILKEKSKDLPKYEVVDHLLSRDTREHLARCEKIVRNLNARKLMEIQLGETVPDPLATVDSMDHVRTLVAEFISEDKRNFQ